MTSRCNNQSLTKPCIPAAFTPADRIVPSSVTSGYPTEALDKLRLDLVQQMEMRHNKLQSALTGLREEMLGTLREDLIRAINSAAQPPVQKPAPEVQAAFSLPEAQKLSANGGPELVVKDSLIPTASPTIELHDNNKRDEKHKAVKETPTVAFAHRPNLHAFMQAKNWDSSHISNLQNHLHEDYSSPQKEEFEAQPAEPKPKTLVGRIRYVVNSNQFDMTVGYAILLNSIVMALNLEFEGEKTRDVIGLSSNIGGWPEADSIFLFFEHSFTLFFLVELILRLTTLGWRYFKSGWNIMDFVIVASSVVDVYGSALVGVNLPNMTFMRLLRIAKLAKVLRVIKVFRFFYQLRVLMSAIMSSIPVLGWSMCLLFILQSISAIFMTQSLQTFLRNEDNDLEDKRQVYEYFGSFARSYMTMFEITLAPGTWGKPGRAVIHKVGSYYTFFFWVYVNLISFAIIRVIAAIFLKETLSAAARDQDIHMANINRDPKYINTIRNIFNSMDEDGNGIITLHELHDMLTNPEIVDYLNQMGLFPHEVKGLFVLMDDGENEISFDEFVAGVMRLKAAAKGVDLPTILYENKKILKRLLAFGKRVDACSDSLSELKNKIH